MSYIQLFTPIIWTSLSAHIIANPSWICIYMMIYIYRYLAYLYKYMHVNIHIHICMLLYIYIQTYRLIHSTYYIYHYWYGFTPIIWTLLSAHIIANPIINKQNYISICIYMYMIYLYISTWICMYIYTYIHIYIYIYIYTHIIKYTYIHICESVYCQKKDS
jgi:hypothetical protein